MRAIVLSFLTVFCVICGVACAADRYNDVKTWNGPVTVSNCVQCGNKFNNPRSVMFNACFYCGFEAATRMTLATNSAVGGEPTFKIMSDYLAQWSAAASEEYARGALLRLFYIAADADPQIVAPAVSKK